MARDPGRGAHRARVGRPSRRGLRDRANARGVPECVGAMDTDGDGTVLLPPLDPNVRWEVYGVAVNTGWPDPLITPDGTEYHLSPTIKIGRASCRERV